MPEPVKKLAAATNSERRAGQAQVKFGLSHLHGGLAMPHRIRAVALASLSLSYVLLASAQQTVTPSQSSTQKAHAGASRTSLLLDTDDDCRLAVDDEDKGVITPALAMRVYVKPGSHMVKCIADGSPDLSWRKLIEAQPGKQATVLISLRALHSQLDEAVAQKNEADAARSRAAARQERRQEQANSEGESKRRQIADIQSRIDDLKQEAEAYEKAAQNAEDQARLAEQQCSGTPAGGCYGGVAAEADRSLARQRRRDAERLNSQIQDLEEQMQRLSAP